MLKRIASSVGLVIGLLGVAFVTRELVRDREVVLAALSGARLASLVPAVLLGLASMTSIGLVWWRCLRVLDADLGMFDALRRYFIGQLGKYVPGGIWPVLGRAEMARRGGVSGPAAYGSTVLSLGLTYLAAILVAAGALVLGAGSPTPMSLAAFGLLPLGLVVLHPSILRHLLGVLRRISGRELAVAVPPWRTSVKLLLAHVPAWIGISLATWLVAIAVAPGGADPFNLIFATTVSWLIGFLAIGVPGGIGVREAVFIAAATSIAGVGVAAAVAVVARALFIIVDVSGAAGTTLTALLAGSRSNETPP